MAGGSDYDVLENYLQEGVAPGTTADPNEGDTTEPGRAADWMARHWWEWRKAREEQLSNALQSDPHKLGMDIGQSLAGGGPELGMAGIMAGPKAAMADLKALRLATKLDRAGHDADSIWKSTGWFKDLDKNWKFEIPDPAGMFDRPGFAFGKSTMPQGHASKGNAPLDASITHPELFENYPEMRDLLFGLRKQSQMPGVMGDYGPGWGIRVADEVLRGAKGNETVAHELQHGVQNIEGFPEGTSPTHVLDSLAAAGYPAYKGNPPGMMGGPASPYELGNAAYHQTAGEIEARNAGLRQGHHPDDLHAVPPWKTAESIKNPIYIHQGHIYAPIDHDPFVGLAEARAELGRPDHPELSPSAIHVPVDHDPFAPVAASQGDPLGPILKNPTPGMLEALYNRTMQMHAQGQTPGWAEHHLRNDARTLRGVIDGNDVHITPAWRNTHDVLADSLNKPLRDLDSFTLFWNTAKHKYDLEVFPSDGSRFEALMSGKQEPAGSLTSGPIYNKIAAQPSVKKLLEREAP